MKPIADRLDHQGLAVLHRPADPALLARELAAVGVLEGQPSQTQNQTVDRLAEEPAALSTSVSEGTTRRHKPTGRNGRVTA